MAPVVKKPCVNNPNYTYSGKEATPLGLGYVAESEQVGHMMEGRDKTMWIVGIKNGAKVWNRIPTELTKEQPVLKNNDDQEVPATPEPAPVPVPTEAKAEPSAPKKKAKETTTVKKDLDKEFETVAPAAPEPKKKRAPAKKTTGEDQAPPPPAKKLSSYNIYMKYRLKKIVLERPDITMQKDRLAACGKEWKALSKEQQDDVIAVAKKELGL